MVKERIKITYKDHEAVSIEKLADFINGCRRRKGNSSIAKISNIESLRMIVVVIEKDQKSQSNKEGGEMGDRQSVDNPSDRNEFTTTLRECPFPEDIPIFIHSARNKTKKHDKSYEDEVLTRESIDKYLLKDLSVIYTEGIDHRLYTITVEEKKEFYRKYSNINILTEIGTVQRIEVERRENKEREDSHRIVNDQSDKTEGEMGDRLSADSPVDESVYFSRVSVNNRSMFCFYKSTGNSILAVDCEMVLTEAGTELARISIVNEYKCILYDVIVETKCIIYDYLTNITGISKETYSNKCICRVCSSIRRSNEYLRTDKIPSHSGTIPYKALLLDLSYIIGIDSVIIGHSISHDLFSINIYHRKIIDTSLLYISRNHHRYRLKVLSSHYLNREIQESTHSSVEDSRVCIDLIKYLEVSPYERRDIDISSIKNIFIDNRYFLNRKLKYSRKITPIFYVFSTEGTEEIEENSIIIRITKEEDGWRVRITNE